MGENWCRGTLKFLTGRALFWHVLKERDESKLSNTVEKRKGISGIDGNFRSGLIPTLASYRKSLPNPKDFASFEALLTPPPPCPTGFYTRIENRTLRHPSQLPESFDFSPPNRTARWWGMLETAKNRFR